MDFKLVILLSALIGGSVSLSYTNDEDPDAFKDSDLTTKATSAPPKLPACQPQPEPKKPEPVKQVPKKLTSKRKPKKKAQPKKVAPKPQGPKYCPTVTAYFDGLFHNQIRPNVDSKAQFQVHLSANKTDQTVYARIDKWNEKVNPSKDFQWGFTYNWCEIGKTCTHPFKDFWGLYLIPRKNTGFDNDYHFLYFDQFKDSFRLEDTIGSCTKVQAKHKCEYETDKALHSFCICCGDKYDPDPVLGCPRSNL